jgi:hypothetical protein
MPASTVEELGDDLDASLQWRRSELASLHSAVQGLARTAESAPFGRALLRSSVALMYAHWEGFTKDALQGYLDFVARRRLKYGDLSDAFATLSLDRVAEL